MKIADIQQVRKEVFIIESDRSVADVARAMRAHDIGAMVVSSGSSSLAGIITERDIVKAIAVGGPLAVNLPAGKVMSSAVPICAPDDHLPEVMKVMLSKRIRHLPLVESGRLVGMVSIGDVIKALVDLMELEANVLRDMYLAARAR